MSELIRTDFSRGWVPSSDAVNGPRNGFLRFDNMVLDELGVAALRRGSARLNSAQFAPGDVHSMYSVNFTIDRGAAFPGPGPRVVDRKVRVVASGNLLWRDLNSIGDPNPWNSFAAFTETFPDDDVDVAFGSYLGQIFMSRGDRFIPDDNQFFPNSSHFKYDTETVRSWGLQGPVAAPTVAAIEPDSKTFATCNSAESPGFTSNEGTQTFANDRDAAANAAVQIVADTTTIRGTSTLTFSSAQNFTAYDAGATGSDDDIVEMYAFVGEPNNLNEVTLMIDVENGDFTNDYYKHTWKANEEVETRTEIPRLLEHEYDLEGQERDRLEDQVEIRRVATALFRPDKDSWNYLSIARGQFERIGGTSGKDWSTVKAVRITFQGQSSLTMRFDNIRIVGGNAAPLKGSYVYRDQYVYDNGVYVAKSPPSAASSEITLENRGANVTVVASADPQVGDTSRGASGIWTFRMGGLLDAFYRVSTRTNTSETFKDTLSDEDALRINERLETDNVLPPNDIVAITGPWFERLFVLTRTHLYPSRRRNPDSYSNGQVIRIGDDAERCYWAAKTSGGLYVGTSKDIYRIDGDGSEHPDGTVDLRKTPLNIANPPIGKALAQEGDLLVYLAADGWRLFNGQSSANITGDTVLLYKGYDRWGVSALNIANQKARFRAALGKGQFVAMIMEGASQDSTTVLYRYDFAKERWYRHVYPYQIRSILREPDGKLLIGSQNGHLYELDSGFDDNGAFIPVTIWTVNDDDGRPENKKDAQQYWMHVDTLGQQLNVDLHADEAAAATMSLAVTGQTSATTFRASATGLGAFTEVHQRMTGDFRGLVLYGFGIIYNLRPRSRRVWHTGLIDVSTDFIWLRQLRVKAIAKANLTVTPYFEDVAQTAQTVTITADRHRIYIVDLGREFKGRLPEVRVTSSSDFEPYWAELYFRPSGHVTEKKRIRVMAEL